MSERFTALEKEARILSIAQQLTRVHLLKHSEHGFPVAIADRQILVDDMMARAAGIDEDLTPLILDTSHGSIIGEGTSGLMGDAPVDDASGESPILREFPAVKERLAHMSFAELVMLVDAGIVPADTARLLRSLCHTDRTDKAVASFLLAQSKPAMDPTGSSPPASLPRPHAPYTHRPARARTLSTSATSSHVRSSPAASQSFSPDTYYHNPNRMHDMHGPMAMGSNVRPDMRHASQTNMPPQYINFPQQQHRGMHVRPQFAMMPQQPVFQGPMHPGTLSGDRISLSGGIEQHQVPYYSYSPPPFLEGVPASSHPYSQAPTHQSQRVTDVIPGQEMGHWTPAGPGYTGYRGPYPPQDPPRDNVPSWERQ